MFFSETEVQVRYAETDAMGVVHHANYIIWFEQGRTEFFEGLGQPYPDIEKKGFLLPVINVQSTYKKAFRYGDKAIIKTSIEEYSRLRVIFKYEIYNSKQELCVEGTTTHVIVKGTNFYPVIIPKSLPELHAAFSNAIC